MNTGLYEKLFEEGCIRQETLNNIREKKRNQLFSLHWELKSLLYLGVMLLSTGLGILIYKNIDTIGHQIILAFIAVICIGCFYYCYRRKKPFNKEKVNSPDSLFDYLLLLACLSFLIFVGYLQFQYSVFGANYGLATFIPMLVLFYVAYDFDHLGILSMAITNLGVWLGISVNPMTLVSDIAESNGRPFILTGLFLGLLLVLVAFLSERFHIKKHFHFTYLHFGTHVTFIALLSGYFYDFEQEISILWIILLLAFTWYIYNNAIRHKSFYFLLLCTIYSYIAISALVIHFLVKGNDLGAIYLAFFYFIVSAIGFIKVLVHLNKKVKSL
jgi:cbb3-type cytochrome oxidase subunit 3